MRTELLTKDIKRKATTRLLQLNDAEASNFLCNLEEISETLEAFDAISSLFEEFYKLLYDTIAAENRDDNIVPVLLNLFQLMRLDAEKCMLTLCRGYVTDSSFHLRRMLETVAIMLELINKPKKLEFYINLVNDKAVKKYVEEFKVFQLVKRYLSKASQDHYETLCLNVHPSVVSTGERGSVNKEKNTHQLLFFDVNSEKDIPRLRKEVLITLLIILEGLRSLGSGLADKAAFDSVAWNSMSAQYFQLVSIYIKQLIASNDLPKLNKTLVEIHEEQQAKRLHSE